MSPAVDTQKKKYIENLLYKYKINKAQKMQCSKYKHKWELMFFEKYVVSSFHSKMTEKGCQPLSVSRKEA